jgi:hypothetical protein
MKTVIVSGGRDFKDHERVFKVLKTLLPIDEIHEGGCPTGADSFARTFAQAYGIKNVTHHADWNAHGKSAGPRRNRSMCQLAVNGATVYDKVIGVFFKGGKGTANCLMNARDLGIAIIEVY